VIQLDVMKMLLKYLPNMGMRVITHEIDIASWCADEVITL
jgi:peptide/nickel transport system ATP-binding protein